MSEDIDKIREDVVRLKNEIYEQEDYFNNELKSKLMKIMNMISARKTFTHFHDSYKLGRLKISFSRFKRSGSRRRKDKVHSIKIRYKYRTVLLLEHNDFTEKYDLKIFHPCEWLSLINTVCEKIPQLLQEEDLKAELELLKKRRKKLKTKCEDFKGLCDE